ncbi:DUF4258 domain-containing protein [Granulicella paludicola]|uniref:DUF4258 domain-containing protein n=1 Tax=Granulicella paludicola TaxID=474951 RepID=UPI0021DFB639|nr:DUF4258 domain-containing protein [Granulicella paludicola]
MGQKKSKVLPFPRKGLAQSRASASKIDINASSGERPPSLAEPDLRLAITRIVHYGTVWQTRHAGQDRSYRNVSDDDIQHMLLGPWALERTPEWSEEHRNWKYRVRGADIEGDELTLIVSVNTEGQKLSVITKF